MLTKVLRKSYLSLPRRFFCHHNPNGMETEELRTKILKTALIHVNRIGWNDQALAEACIDLGYPSVTSRVVSNGAIDLVYFAVDEWNDKLSEDLSYLELEEMRISDRIIEGIKIRLSYQIPYISRWHEALALGGLPYNGPTTMHKLVRIADDIWYIAGDRSTDYNWYTKRGLLLSAYATTELFMLTDKSHNYTETWKFLERRIKDILTYGKYINTFKNYSSAVTTGLGSLISMVAGQPARVENDIEDLRYHHPPQHEEIIIKEQDKIDPNTETQVKLEVGTDEKGEEQLKIKKQKVKAKKDSAEGETIEEETIKKSNKAGKKVEKKDIPGDGIY